MRKTILLLSILICIILSSCQSSPVYLDVETTDINPITENHPWLNQSAFSYVNNNDLSDRVINCMSTGSNTYIEIDNEMIYFLNKSTVVRYNPKENRMTYLCSDPLCTHNSPDCPFYGIDTTYSFHIYNDRIFYRQQFKYRENGIVKSEANRVSCYHFKEQKLTALRDIKSPALSSAMVFYDNVYLYTDINYDEATSSYTYALCCQNIDTGKVEIIIKEDSWNISPLFEYNNRVYFWLNDEQALYSSDKNNISDMVRICGYVNQLAYSKNGYFIFSDKSGDLFRMNEKGTDAIKLGIDKVDYFYITNNYIYYIVTESVFEGYTENKMPVSVNMCEIYRSDHNGNSKELVWKNKDSNHILNIHPFVVRDGYLYAIFDYYIIDNSIITGYSSRSRDFSYVRINSNDGKLFYINVGV